MIRSTFAALFAVPCVVGIVLSYKFGSYAWAAFALEMAFCTAIVLRK